MACKLSVIVPTKYINDENLRDLGRSIDMQDFPKDQLEVLIISEGTSESAKAIGIKQAKGEVICFLASDNELMNRNTLWNGYVFASEHGAAYPAYYHYDRNDNVLNRYFALIGGNDVLSFYIGKNDRLSHAHPTSHLAHDCTIGDNGYFIQKRLIEKTDLDNYYHIDNALEASRNISTKVFTHSIWHKTGGNIFHFLAKRYRYGLQHAFNKNRRWHLVDFTKPGDVWKLVLFISFSLTLLQPLYFSIRGYLKKPDVAWCMHPIMSLATVFLYGVLVAHIILRRLLSLSPSAPTDDRRA